MAAAATYHRGPSLPATSATFGVSNAVAPQAQCPNCGYHDGRIARDGRLPESAQRRIAELEAQVKLLTEKATTAADKLADYEDELRQLKSSQAQTNGFYSASDSNLVRISQDSDDQAPRPRPTNVNTVPKQTRLSAFLGRRSPTPNTTPVSASPSARESDLEASLAREQSLRQKAENTATQLSSEMEDLSVQLFQQANEMVAEERKARAKLEERVAILEQRDDEKRKRLERLEGAMKRIDRVRGILGNG